MKAFAKLFPRTKKVTSTTGHPHISKNAATGKFRADIRLNDERQYIGLYESLEEALAAQVRALSKELADTHEDYSKVCMDYNAVNTELAILNKELLDLAAALKKPELQQLLFQAQLQHDVSTTIQAYIQ